MLRWPQKDPEEVLDFTVDFTDWLVGAAVLQGGDTTVTMDGTSVPGGLTNLTVSNVVTSTTKVTVWLTGGTSGEKYKFKVKVKDGNSPQRVGVRRATIKVKVK